MKKIISVLPLILLSACGSNEQPKAQPVYQQPVEQPIYQQPVAQPQQAPVIIQQPAQQQSGMQDMLIGGLIGHAMAGGSGSRQAAQPTTVINRTYVNKTVINKPYSAPQRASSYRRK